jgi:hypothetical protein
VRIRASAVRALEGTTDMLRRHALTFAAAGAALAASPTAALGADRPDVPPVPPALDADPPGPHDTVAARMHAHVHPRLVDQVVAAARTRARLRRETLRPAYRRAADGWSPRRLRAERRQLRRELRRLRAGHDGTGAAIPAGLQAIAACESGGNPRAVDATGTYRGKYQFDLRTWQAVGGSGDPAAAPEAEQDRRAAILLARAGTAPWPVCGG